jgi:outer membrane protein assembly factor BamB
VGGGIDRQRSQDEAPARWLAFADAYTATLPALYRYLYRGTGGDVALTDELTGAMFLATVRAYDAGDTDAVSLGPLHDRARALLVVRAVGPGSDPPAIPAPGPPPGEDDQMGVGDPATASRSERALRSLRLDHRVVLGLGTHDELPPEDVAGALGIARTDADALAAEAHAALQAADGGQVRSADDLRSLFAELDAGPTPGFATALRARLQDEIAPRRRRSRRGVRIGEAALDPLAPALTNPPAGDGPARGAVLRWRRWAVPGAAVVAAIAMVLVTAGGETGDGGNPGDAGNLGDGQSGARPTPATGDTAATTTPVDPTAPSAALLAPAPLGADRPPTSAPAEVLDRVHVGPGGGFMNGPYAVAAGPDGVWTTAVDDAGTWRALRIDPATGDVLAELRVPGSPPTDRRHHGVALSGGYVWVPAIRDGLFRIDAATNVPSGLVGVEGGLDGSTLAGGDGAVWAVGNDGTLRRIDATTTEVTAQSSIGEMGLMPGGMDLAYGGGSVWVTVAAPDGRHLISFDPTTLVRRSHVLLPPVGPLVDPYDLAAIGDIVILTERRPGGVTVVDGAAGRILSQHRFPTAGIGVDGGLAWVSSSDESLATALRPSTGELVTAVTLPPGIEEMVAVGDGTVWGTVPVDGELVRLRLPEWRPLPTA